MIIAVHQPQYLPWLGYFDKMRRADVFCYLNDVQYKKNEWQNRNRIKNAQGWQWLTVPVLYKYPQMINEVTASHGSGCGARIGDIAHRLVDHADHAVDGADHLLLHRGHVGRNRGQIGTNR